MTRPDPATHPAPFTQSGEHPAQPPAAPSTRRAFWTRGPGIIVLIVAGGLVLFGVLALVRAINPQTTAKDLSVDVTSCTVTGRTATVGLEVTNTGPTTKSATISIEYRDSNGARLDTDTAHVSGIASGDTARTEESTILDAQADSGTCVVTGVR